MNRYLWLFLSLLALLGYAQPGHAHSRAAPAHTAQAAPMAGAGPAAEPGSHAPAATVPERRPVISYSTSEAAVQLEYDYEGRMQPDVAQTLTLRFRHGYTAGVMRVAFYAHDDLELYNAEALRSLPLDAAQPLSVPIRLTAPSAGQYYLSIFATVELPDGEVAHRIFGLDLHAGDESEIASQAMRVSKTRRVRETQSVLLRHSARSRTIQEPRAQSLLLRHSARSRGIQQPRAQSVLQAFLDAATARSMTRGVRAA